MGLCKDEKKWQRKSEVKENIEEIAGFLDDKKLKEKLWGNYKKGNKKDPDRTKCLYYPNRNRKKRNGKSNNDNIVETEKRMCRCMFYCNKKSYKKCEKCEYKYKYYIDEKQKNIEITNYELPTKYVVKNIGNVDICLKYNNVDYAVEVKPYPNDGDRTEETLARMLVEILTYILDEKMKRYKPAIMFPKGKEQDKEFDQYKELPAMKKIMEKVAFFRYKRTSCKKGYIFTIEKIK